MSSSIPIIDSHIHLFDSSSAPSHNWYTPSSPLSAQHSLPEYLSSTTSAPQPPGFILIEADRKNGSSKDWTNPLEEISFARSIVTGEQGNLCLAIIPWAPLNLGSEKLQEYLTQAESQAGPETWAKIKGFRYLLQDKPNCHGLTDSFIDSLKLLGRKKYVFDVGIDQHRRGRIQLEELVDIIDRSHEDVEEDDKVVFILNHLCKPDLSIRNQTVDPAFIAWRTAMFTLSKCHRTYMKLSGLFEEMPESLSSRSPEEIVSAILPWLAVVVAAFGPNRIMFGSNWPVCTLAVPEEEKENAWKKWHRVVELVCDLAGLGEEDQAMLWSGTAKKAYNI
ncbi:hypothetical protein QBC38DRAFT_474209 [Podospora fimiseda]|uniref:Amidohydrolase-related domain-containing protein n=1 Tax=Podospora fimiseda TaxID=252190 RepID=A0AAN7BS82_9PEZI|nr:hypothetical protein QBC38DRAFT_474209 [Podospora fimiseda]